jgi:hypothetical protein
MNETDRAILAFESEWWRHAGNKERVIRERFGLSPARYYQRLNRLLEEPEALAQQPALVHRLARLRQIREHRRASRPRG